MLGIVLTTFVVTMALYLLPAEVAKKYVESKKQQQVEKSVELNQTKGD